jgi:N-formylglutamate deformylase
MTRTYPFLFSIPHAGTMIPDELQGSVLLDHNALGYYSDPGSRSLFHFPGRVAASIDTPISRLFVDLNRPPYHLPPRHPDGVVKVSAVDGSPIYREGMFPDMARIQHLMMTHYFPYHAEIDRLIRECRVRLAFDCHCMLPVGVTGQKDEGEIRPHVCLGNHGDTNGHARTGTLTTCPAAWIQALAEVFRDTLPQDTDVRMNTPYSGGFISLSHYWHTGVPWIQLEVNRSLFEESSSGPDTGIVLDEERIREFQENIWKSLTVFWDTTAGPASYGQDNGE